MATGGGALSASEARGSHAKVGKEVIKDIPVDKSMLTAERKRNAAFKRAPVAVRLSKVLYPDGKVKWLQESDIDLSGGTARADKKPEIITKRRVVCIYKNGKVLSGKWPEGQEMPADLKATIARAQKLLNP